MKSNLCKWCSKDRFKHASRIGDEGPTASEEGLFKMSALKTTSDLDTVLDSKPEDIASDSDGRFKIPCLNSKFT